MQLNKQLTLVWLQVLAVQESLERDLELLCLTGVEDKLQVSSNLCL